MTLVTIGRVTAPFGVKGAVKVYPLSDFLERCYQLKKVTLFHQRREGSEETAVVQNSFVHGRQWVLHFEGYNTRDEALELKGALVQISPEERVPLPEGQFYIDDLVGLKALTKEGKSLGTVKDIIQTGSNDVYVIEGVGQDNKEILVPALNEVVLKVDLEEKIVILDLPDGLLDVYEVIL